MRATAFPPRRRRFWCGGALLLGLLLSGCGSGSSGPATTYNGSWEGTGSSGAPVSFIVASDEVFSLVVEHEEAGCTWQVTRTGPLAIDNEAFEYRQDESGHTVIQCTFTSSMTATGSYSFKHLKVTGTACPDSVQGTFDVVRVR